MTKDPIHLETRLEEGAKRYSPSAGRNKADIALSLIPHIKQSAHILEIASGTGEHAYHMCALRPDILWQTSDPDPESRASQTGWAVDCRTNGAGNMLAPLNIDVCQPGWAAALPEPSYDMLYCANMIHIAPWEACTGMVGGAKGLLKSGGLMALYGPFLEGSKTAQSNLQFDQTLKARNPDWGVRNLSSVKHIFADAVFNMADRIEMPKENRLIIFEKIF